MQSLTRFLARAAFYSLAGLGLAWTSYLTYSFISRTLPHLGAIAPAFALIVFDGGVLAWLLVFLHHADGVGQRAVALFGCIFDLLGVGLMVISEVFLTSGQTLTTAPEALGQFALWGIGLWTVTLVALVVAFHLLSPDALREMAVRGVQEKIQAKAMKQLDGKASEIAEATATQISDELLDHALRTLRVRGFQSVVTVPTEPAVDLALPHAANGHTAAAALAMPRPPKAQED